jgi:hypothetical protein
VPAYVLPAGGAELVGEAAIAQQVEHRCRALIEGIDRLAAGTVWHLQRDAAGAPCDDRRALPQRL